MDLPNTLSAITRYLFNGKARNGRVYIFRPTNQSLQRWIVVLNFEFENVTLKSSATSKTLFDAYIKAVAELGENFILESSDLYSRCGIAGGLIKSETIIRAKSELIERDAFLFHYRNQIPFSSCTEVKPDNIQVNARTRLLAFRMQTSDPGFTSFLVTDSACASGKSECLLFGTSAHPHPKTALEKAIQEYSAIYLNHQKNNNWCLSIAQKPRSSVEVMEIHHAASRDLRNKVIFNRLCNPKLKNRKSEVTRPPLSVSWKIEELDSPVKFIQFFRVDHPDLMKLQFGIPEITNASGVEPLFHPFW